MRTPPDKQAAAKRPNVSQPVIWLQQRTWGGKQNVPAIYLHGVGTGSARIRIDSSDEEKTVRLKSLRWAIREGEVNRNE